MKLDYDYISIEGFLVKTRKKKSSHVFTNTVKGRSWPVHCIKCGLIKLNNKATRKAIKSGCIHYFDDIVGKI